MIAKFRNGGQACTAANTFLVQEEVRDALADAMKHRMELLTLGPASSGALIGPLISKRALDGVSLLVEQAVAAGSRVHYQADMTQSAGHFFPPTLLTDVPTHSTLVSQEIFGPVAPIVTWTNQEDLVNLVNSNNLGLASYVFSGDLSDAMHIAEQLDVGMGRHQPSAGV